jgi:hypothetical protein
LTDTPLRILKGEALYKDINSLYPPVACHFIALLYKVFSGNLRTLRVTLAVTGAITAWVVFHLARRLTSVSYAVVVTGIAFLLGPICLNYPYHSWFCIPLGLCMVLSEHRGWKKRLTVYHLLAGMIAGTIFSLKENWGVFALAALLCTQSFEGLFTCDNGPRSPARTAKEIVLLVPLFSSILILSLLLIREHLSLGNVVLFSVPALAIAVTGMILLVMRQREGHTVHVHVSPMIISLIGFMTVVLPWVSYYLIQLGMDGFYKALILPLRAYAQSIYVPLPSFTFEVLLLVCLALCQGVMIVRGRTSVIIRSVFLLILWSFLLLLVYEMIPFVKEGVLTTKTGDYNTWGFGLACYLPFAVHIGLPFILMRDFRNLATIDRSRLHLSVSLWIYSVAAAHVFYPLMDIYHLIWISAPVMVLGGIFIFRSLEMWESKSNRVFTTCWQKTARCCPTLIIPLFVALFFGLPILNLFVRINTSPFQVRIAEFSDINSDRAGILMPEPRATSISEVVGFIESQTAPDEFVFDMTGSFFHFLADRRNPTPWPAFTPSFISPQDIDEIKRDLETLGPRIAVTSTVADWWLSSNFPDLYRFIYSRYEPVRLFGKYAVLVLREEKAPEYEEMDDGGDPPGLKEKK